ncbi:MAG: hypothetical protein ACT6RD_07505 [Brevundimonas sp.]|uniref:hypothetical protein n=1 Tax=Brevundimonas sp. TaxID=1871086 RepID=UPI00403359BF
MHQSLDLLVEEASAWTARWATLEPQPALVDPEHRYRIRSSFQKSIRRGQVGRAVTMALALHRLDPRYAWRSALTVAVEDIGIGLPDAVFWATAGQRVGFRRAVGELPFLIALTRCMALAVKSRSAIEIAFVTETGEPEIFRLFGGMTTGRLLARVSPDDPYETFAAVSVLRGVVPKAYRVRPPDQAGLIAACEIIADQTEPCIARACRAALLHPLDEMSLGLVAAALLRSSSGPPLTRYDPMPDSVMIDGFPSETFDQHERLGRRAIGQFTKALLPDLPELQRLSPSKAQAAVSDAIFVEETQCLDQWIGGADLDRLRDEADRFSLTRHGLSADDGEAVRRSVRDRLPALNDLRRTVVRDAQ